MALKRGHLLTALTWMSMTRRAPSDVIADDTDIVGRHAVTVAALTLDAVQNCEDYPTCIVTTSCRHSTTT